MDVVLGGGGIEFRLKERNRNLNEFKIIFKNQTPNLNQWRVFTKIKNPIREASRVKFVGFVDSDDVIKPHTYEQAFAPMEKDKRIDCVIFGAESFGEVEQKRLEQLNEYLRIKYNGKIEINERLMLEITNNCWNKLFLLDLMRKYRLYFPQIEVGEDEVFVFCYLALCQSVYFIDNIFYLYRLRGDSACAVMIRNKTYNHIDALYDFKYIVEFYQKNGFFSDKDKLLYRTYAKFVKDALYANDRTRIKHILNLALKLSQEYLMQDFKSGLKCNHLHQTFKFGNEKVGHSKELLCVDLFGETILEKRTCYFLHFLTRKFKILTTLYTNGGKISYIKLGQKKLIIHRKAI